MFKISIIALFMVLISTCENHTLDSERMTLYQLVAEEVLADSIPNLEAGESHIVESQGLDIWYELFKPDIDGAKGTILLIQGIGETAMAWEQYTYQPLVDSAYNVIRFDNREVGRSTWTKKINYDLSDMAKDVLAILDDSNIESVHLVGQSMGGMIAQEFALLFPEKLKTLTLIYSTGHTYDKNLTQPELAFEKNMASAFSMYDKPALISQIKLELAIKDALNVDPLEKDELLICARRMRFEIEKRKGNNENAFDKQAHAIKSSGARWHRLNQLKMPVLIIHGAKDPICPIDHGKKLADLIPHAKTKWVEDHGHYITTEFSEVIVNEIIRLIEK